MALLTDIAERDLHFLIAALVPGESHHHANRQQLVSKSLNRDGQTLTKSLSLDLVPITTFEAENDYSCFKNELHYMIQHQSKNKYQTKSSPSLKKENNNSSFNSSKETQFSYETTATTIEKQKITYSPTKSTTSGVVDRKRPTRPLRRVCRFPECDKRIRSRGLCKSHGGGRMCKVEGCKKGSQTGGLCIAHGGGKRCKIDRCPKAAQSYGLCKAHGGGARCTYPSCDRSSQGKGRCRTHGGGRRCVYLECTKGAQRGDYCATHGGVRRCQADDCVRVDRGGGFCEVHRRDKLCLVPSCSKLARISGLCTIHNQ